MAKNLLDILKGAGGGSGAGVKGTWDVTPVVDTVLTAVDTINLTWNSATNTATADWTNAGTPTNGLPVAGAAILNATVGDLAVNQVKQFALKASADFFAVTQGAAMLSFTVVPATMTADQLRQLFVNFVLNPSQVIPTPIMQTFMQYLPGQGAVAMAQSNLATDTSPFSPNSTVGYLTEALSADHYATVFFTRKQPGGEGTETEIHLAEAVFRTDGTLVGLGPVDFAGNNPVLPPNSKLAVVILYLPQNATFEPVSCQVSMTAAPSSITLPPDFGTTPSAGQGSFNGVTQGDLDLVFANPATDIVSITVPPFPIGTKKNDMWRVRNTTPAVQAIPYGTPVLNDDIIIVDNVTPGSEAIRVDVYSPYLTQQLAAPMAKAEEALAKAAAAGTVGGKAVFFVRSNDAFLSDPLPTTAQNVYATFLAAYQAAIALPKHIQKIIVIDNRSTNQQQTIPEWTDPLGGTNVFYLVANNIKLSTMTFWERHAGGKLDGLSFDAGSALQQTVIVRGLYDGLHFAGGAFSVAWSGDSFTNRCVPFPPSQMIWSPGGSKRALEVGDFTQLYLSPLAFNFDNWGDFSSVLDSNNSLRIGDHCYVGIFPDLSAGSAAESAGALVFGTYIASSDTNSGHLTPGRLNYFPAGYNLGFGGIDIYLGENSDFIIGAGAAYYGAGADGVAGFNVHTTVKPGTISFGDTGTQGTYPTASTITYDGSANSGLEEVVVNINSPSGVGHANNNPFDLSADMLNKRVLVDNNALTSASLVFTPDESGFVRITDALLNAFIFGSIDAVEITLKSTTSSDATFDGSHNLTSSGRVPIYVMVNPGNVVIDRDEVIDGLFSDGAGGTYVAFRLDNKPVNGKSVVPTIRLERKAQGIGGIGISPTVSLSINRSKASRQYRALANGQLNWSDVGGVIRMESSTPTYVLPQRGFGGATPEALGMDLFMSRTIEFQALGSATTVTLDAGVSGQKIYDGTDTAGVTSKVFNVPAFGKLRLTYWDHGVASSYTPGWAVFS